MKTIINSILLCLLTTQFISCSKKSIILENLTKKISPQRTTETPYFFDDFKGNSLNTNNWLVAKRNWGGQISGDTTLSFNGGVTSENVIVNNGKVEIYANGNNYSGSKRGINKDLSIRSDGKKTGGCIVTKQYFGSGKYEVRMKVIPQPGVVSAMWTFHYQEIGAGPTVINHEIDIEIPGRATAGPPYNPDFNYALMNSWVGELGGEYTTGYTNVGLNLADSQFHTYRFDWHTGGNGITPHIEFYIDGNLKQNLTTNIPFNAGRFWIGAWFANAWAGTPNFTTEVMEIDWVKITPFYESNDKFISETYPDAGYAN